MKDPALLFYTANFLAETRRMSFEQIGKYIKLLCIQHQDDHLTKEEFFEIVSPSDKLVIEKFSIDDNGSYFIQHVDDEIERRRKYSIGRAENAKKRKPKEIPIQEEHMQSTC